MSKKSVRLAVKTKKNKGVNRRASVGDAMGLTPRKPTEANLQDDVVMDAALAAAAHLNSVSKGGKKKKKKDKRRKGRRSSIALM